MVVIALAGWTSNHFSSLAFPGRSDMTSAIGSFVVGTLGSLYGKFSNVSWRPSSYRERTRTRTQGHPTYIAPSLCDKLS